MFSVATFTTHTRVAQLAALLILLAAIVLLALGLVGADEAQAGTRCPYGRC